MKPTKFAIEAGNIQSGGTLNVAEQGGRVVVRVVNWPRTEEPKPGTVVSCCARDIAVLNSSPAHSRLGTAITGAVEFLRRRLIVDIWAIEWEVL